MWNDGKQILWSHFSRIVHDDLNHGLKIAPKLTQEHAQLNPYSCMNVRLAAQTLSSTVANILKEYYPAETHGTSQLCENMDKFFDCLNVRNQLEGVKKRKPFLLPYRSVEDERFKWLEHCLLKYLSDWKQSVVNRPGNFSQASRDKMFLSRQTHEGIQITTYSVIEATKFLLCSGMEFVLTEKFNQDVVEEYFGRQRSFGRRNDNPSMYQFGYNANTIRMQRSIAPVTGNTKGAHKQKRRVSWFTVDDQPLKKRQ